MTKIEELKAAFEAATSGVWVSRFVTCEMTDKDPPYAEQTVQTPTGLIEVKGLREGEDAKFIALSHNMMPQLLEAANHLAECQELLRDYPWVYQKCKRILGSLR